jgi:hypothetical protein
MLTALLWTLTICACIAMGGATTIAVLALADEVQARMRARAQLKEAEQEFALKALRSASREVD